MTAQEMLIEVNTSLQMIGASRTRKFYPQEIEWYLNKGINRFVQGCIRHKENTSNGYSSRDVDVTVFEIDELYRDALRNLLVEKYLPADYNPNGLSARAYLPPSYSYLTDIGACCTQCTPFSTITLQSNIYQVVGIPFPPDSTATNGQYFSNLSITINGTEVYSRSGSYTYASVFQLIEEVCEYSDITQNMVGPYSRNGYLLLMLPKPTSGDLQFTISYESTTYTSALLGTITAMETGVAQGRANVPTRTVRDTNRYNSKTTAYYEVTEEDVPADIKGYIINLDTAPNFIVNGVLVTYIRKPARVSVSLNNTSDIAPEFHNQICDMTVQMIRERIGDPKYQTGMIDSKQGS